MNNKINIILKTIFKKLILIKIILKKLFILYFNKNIKLKKNINNDFIIK